MKDFAHQCRHIDATRCDVSDAFRLPTQATGRQTLKNLALLGPPQQTLWLKYEWALRDKGDTRAPTSIQGPQGRGKRWQTRKRTWCA